ncbi:MAG: dTMP kinase [Verrucomicrobiales bacterium]|jgi:dTMP kinase|nr:dTMP kinase [Verrucomicrobiales bacterium]
MKPRFITFEGSEGCGKTTQISLLADWFKQRGQTVTCLREPGATPLGEAVRHLLKHDPAGHGMAAESELLLFTASRAELVRKVIQPALTAGRWIICDRFHDSTTVYQSIARGLDRLTVSVINDFALGGTVPTLTLFLDLPAAESRARMLRRPRPVGQTDRMENEPPEFYEKVTNGYRQLADSEPSRIKRIDADGDKRTVFEKILSEVKNAFHGQLD